MTKEEALTYYDEWQQKYNAYALLLSTASFDAETIAPPAGSNARNEALSFLYGEMHDIETDPKILEVLEVLKDSEDPVLARRVALDRRSLLATACLSKEEVTAFSREQLDAFDDWQIAKHEKDYARFEPHLLKLIEFSKTFAKKREPEKDPYEVYLDDYEEGMTRKDYDEFFELIRREISPLVKAVAAKDGFIDDSFLHRYYDKERQAKFGKAIHEFMAFDPSWGYMGVSEHPFTDGLSLNDVRITTAYEEHDVSQSLYSIVHETGHAYFEHQVSAEYAGTSLHRAISSGMHESQSRFLENYIGRRESFLQNLYPTLQELYPQELKDIGLHEFWKAVNVSRPSLIRTAADELTYPLHILIRYEIEKMIFDGTADLQQLNTLWNRKYKEYLGVEVPDDGVGILQDVHWSGASFGYFPTYALGSAIGAQLLAAMEKDLDIDALLQEGKFTAVTDWLKEHFQKHGARYTFKEAVKLATGEEFSPHYYIDHLKKKYTALYEL